MNKSGSEIRAAGIRVMIVDDEPELMQSMKEYLQWFGFDVLGECSATQASSKMESFRPHLLISDIRMPRINGLEMVHSLRVTYPTLPIILISGSLDPPCKNDIGNLNIFQVFQKPLDLRQLACACALACKIDPAKL